jgi:hypothetical protein
MRQQRISIQLLQVTPGLGGGVLDDCRDFSNSCRCLFTRSIMPAAIAAGCWLGRAKNERCSQLRPTQRSPLCCSAVLRRPGITARLGFLSAQDGRRVVTAAVRACMPTQQAGAACGRCGKGSWQFRLQCIVLCYLLAT